MYLLIAGIMAFCLSTAAGLFLLKKGRWIASFAALLVNLLVLGGAAAILYKTDPATHHKQSGSMGIVAYLALVPAVTWLNLLLIGRWTKK